MNGENLGFTLLSKSCFEMIIIISAFLMVTSLEDTNKHKINKTKDFQTIYLSNVMRTINKDHSGFYKKVKLATHYYFAPKMLKNFFQNFHFLSVFLFVCVLKIKIHSSVLKKAIFTKLSIQVRPLL